MFLELFFELRRRHVPVTTQEWLALMQALSLGLHDTSLDGLYHLARALCVKDVAHYDSFDAAFLAVFSGFEADALAVTDELLAWLSDPRRRAELTPEELALLEQLDLETLRRRYAERLAEQRGRHDGGGRWIGTGGTSPFGTGGRHPTGVRVGPSGGGRSAMQIAAERRFREYRRDEVLDVRRLDVALRLLRDLGREGAPDELDLEGTIDSTARNAGELEVRMRAPRRNRAKVLLLMDVGGSMEPHARLVSQLFTAASRVGRFARLRALYFHNCVYEGVYQDAGFRQFLSLADLVGTSDRDEKLIFVGDAAMHPSELFDAGGSIYYGSRTATVGLESMRRLAAHFRRAAWLNPDPEAYWDHITVAALRALFPMFALTIDGLSGAVSHLRRSRSS